MESSSSDNQKRPVPLLTRENHEFWFRQMTNLLIGKDAAWVINEKWPAPSLNLSDQFTLETTTPQSGTSTSTSTPPATDPPLRPQPSQHSVQFIKANATATYWICQCLSYTDNNLIQSCERAKDAWKILQNKYTKKLQTSSRQYQQQYASYKMEEGTSIDEGWDELMTMARRITAIDPELKELYTEKRVVQQLLSALPDRYSQVRYTLDIIGKKEPEEILSVLYEEEARDSPEIAMGARFGNQEKRACLLCDETTHYIKDCPILPAAKKLRKQQSKKGLDTHKRRSPPRRRPSPAAEDLKAMVKQLALEVSKLKRPSGRKGKAYPAEEASSPELETSPSSNSPSEGEEYETAEAAAEAQRKLPQVNH